MAQSAGAYSAAARLPESAAERLEQVRKECGFETLADLHEALQEEDGYSVSYSSVSNYHDTRKNREAPASYFVRVAEVTGASLGWLLRGEGPMFVGRPPEVPVEELQPVPEEEAIGAFWDALPGWDEMGFEAVGPLAYLQKAFRESGDELGIEDHRRFARDLAKLLRLPYSRLGFTGPPAGRTYSLYVLSLASTLLLVMPRRGARHTRYPFVETEEKVKA